MEIFDLYDRNRQRSGMTMARGTAMLPGTYRLVVHVCLFNREGRLLIQQRQPFKNKWAGLWDLSAAGSAVAGEDSHSAAERETLEELNLKIDLSDTQPSLTVHWARGFDDIYLLTLDHEPNDLRLQEEEVRDVRWASLSDTLEMIDDGSFIPYEKSFIELLFRLREHRDIHTREDDTSAKKKE